MPNRETVFNITVMTGKTVSQRLLIKIITKGFSATEIQTEFKGTPLSQKTEPSVTESA